MTHSKTILFKQRNFGDYINDTFTFLKQEGKPFLLNFARFFGGYLLLFLFLIYILVDLFYDSITSSTSTELDVVIANNLTIVVVSGIGVFALALYLSIALFSYPVYYLQNLTHPNPTEAPSAQIKQQLRGTIGRGFVFLVLTSLLVFPVVMLAYLLASILLFLIIGIPLLFLIGPFSASIVSLAYYEYVTNKTTFFAAYQKAFTLFSVDFWGSLGNAFIFLFIIQLLGYLGIIVPNMLMEIRYFIASEDLAMLQQIGIDKVLLALLVLTSTAISVLLYLVFMINQGIVYYSARERKESYQSMLDIETIGKNHE